MNRRCVLGDWAARVLLGLAPLVATAAACSSKPPASVHVNATLGDLYIGHALVKLGEHEVNGELRVSEGDVVSTGPEGRARVRLDDATLVEIDANTTFSVGAGELSLQRGRLFLQTAKSAHTQVKLGAVSAQLSASSANFLVSDAKSQIYCAAGEVLITQGSNQARVRGGETATLGAAEPSIVPEKAFDDWTGGLAVPWGSPAATAVSGVGDAVGDASAIPEVRALSGATDPGTPLVIRAHEVRVAIDGELALTKSHTRYFNGGSGAAQVSVRFALPHGAILKRVARAGSGGAEEAQVAIAAGPSRTTEGTWQGVEWAGGGWLTGQLSAIGAGETLDLELEYAQWLDTDAGRTTYRYPMAAGNDAPLVSELTVDIDAPPSLLSLSRGASVEGKHVLYRAADAHPTSDVVLEWSAPNAHDGSVRAYVADAQPGEDPYVMLRTEVPERSDTGVSLALVVDSSMSIGAGALETTRAVVDALLQGLGPSDSVVVLAADQSVHVLGSDSPRPVTAELRRELRTALGALRAGGASNIGAALQRAADAIDAPSRGEQAGRGMVVYLGDGRPTVGEPDAASIRRMLTQRAGGTPRLATIAIGSAADRWTLSRLSAGIGPSYQVIDRSDAARAGSALVSEALRPTLRDVWLDPGATIDRIYPRDPRAIVGGSTVTMVGRLRGKLPQKMNFRFRDGAVLKNEERQVLRLATPGAADVPQRWATARVEEMALRDEGIEPAIALAAEFHLLTPWTSWFFSAPGAANTSRPFADRILDLSPTYDTPFAARVDGADVTGSTLLEPPATYGGGASLDEAVEAAVRRILRRASNAIRACRDARASVRSDVGNSFDIDVSVDGKGIASNVHVRIGNGGARDAALERCIIGVVKSLPFLAFGTSVKATQAIILPEARSSGRTQCSSVSKISLPLKRSIWRARTPIDASAYLSAARSCELGRWTDRRAFLQLLLEKNGWGSGRLQIANELEEAGEQDAADFIRKETLRRVTDFNELQSLSQQLIADEPRIDDELDKAYDKAKSDEGRLAVVRQFLRLAPHSQLARRRLLALLQRLGQTDELLSEVEALRSEPFIDAGLLALGASLLWRSGLEEPARRTFGELVERAPGDPWTLAYVGDRLRAEGLFDEACAVYENLERALPDDAGVILRLALGHAGAGRLDVATRLLDRVAQTGGRNDDGRVGELSSIARAVLLAAARGGPDPSAEAEIERRLLQTPLPDVKSLLFIQSAPDDEPLEVSVVRERGEKEPQSADLDSRAVGVSAVRIERGDGSAELRLRRNSTLGVDRPLHATVYALVLEAEQAPKLLRKDVDVAAGKDGLDLEFNGEAFL